jgi:vacuolar-type H+-ATPase subunit I/STV1
MTKLLLMSLSFAMGVLHLTGAVVLILVHTLFKKKS